MQSEYDNLLHTTFIFVWRWIIDQFSWILEDNLDLGARNSIKFLITLIPNQNLRLLVEEYEYAALDEFIS